MHDLSGPSEAAMDAAKELLFLYRNSKFPEQVARTIDKHMRPEIKRLQKEKELLKGDVIAAATKGIKAEDEVERLKAEIRRLKKDAKGGNDAS